MKHNSGRSRIALIKWTPLKETTFLIKNPPSAPSILSKTTAQVPQMLKFKMKVPGDSGGPVVMKRGSKYVLAGVVSWGSNICAQPGHQDVSNDNLFKA